MHLSIYLVLYQLHRRALLASVFFYFAGYSRHICFSSSSSSFVLFSCFSCKTAPLFTHFAASFLSLFNFCPFFLYRLVVKVCTACKLLFSHLAAYYLLCTFQLSLSCPFSSHVIVGYHFFSLVMAPHKCHLP